MSLCVNESLSVYISVFCVNSHGLVFIVCLFRSLDTSLKDELGGFLTMLTLTLNSKGL